VFRDACAPGYKGRNDPDLRYPCARTAGPGEKGDDGATGRGRRGQNKRGVASLCREHAPESFSGVAGNPWVTVRLSVLRMICRSRALPMFVCARARQIERSEFRLVRMSTVTARLACFLRGGAA
jgi:hypothetical protein